MTYLYVYLGIGAVFLAVIFVLHQASRSPIANQVHDLTLAADPRADKWWWWPLNKVVIPILAGLTALVAWPIAIYWKAKEMANARDTKEVDPPKPPKKFAVTRDHLLKQCSLSDIETSEIISDPLEATPGLPFGHLNPAWEAFKRSIQHGDQLWSFSAPSTLPWEQIKISEGYVILRGDTIGPHFLSRLAPLDNEIGED